MKEGNKKKALGLLDRSAEFDRGELNEGSEISSPLLDLAAVSATRGNKDEALSWLQKAIDAGWRDPGMLAVDPAFEDIRADGRFKVMVEEVKRNVDEMRKRVDAIDSETPSGS